MVESQTHPASVEGQAVIELKLRNLDQMFNSMDPSPFHEKDLDDDAEEFIVGWARELPPHAIPVLVVHLENFPAQDDPTALLRESVRHFFEYKAELTRREFRHLISQGRTSLIIGLVFLATCLAVGELVHRHGSGPVHRIVYEGLLISGWVAMWRPLQIFLYEWWPLQRLRRVYEKLSKMQVLVRPVTPTGVIHSPT